MGSSLTPYEYVADDLLLLLLLILLLIRPATGPLPFNYSDLLASSSFRVCPCKVMTTSVDLSIDQMITGVNRGFDPSSLLPIRTKQ